MNISEGFIARPVATTLIQLSIVIFGIIGYRTLPVSDLPTVDFPTIQVGASLPEPTRRPWPHRSRPRSRSSSREPARDRLDQLVEFTRSTSITLQFALDRNIDAAAQDVQIAIARVQRQLPPDMPSLPPDAQPGGGRHPDPHPHPPTMPLSDVNEYADTTISQRISTVKGVAQVNLFGAQKRAIRVDANPWPWPRATSPWTISRFRRPART